MDSRQTEEQNIIELKKYWKKYGPLVTKALLIFFLAMIGTKYYQNHKAVKSEQAAIIYESVLAAIQNKDYTTLDVKANELIKDYNNTPYANLSRLIIAKSKIDQNKIEEAINELKIINNEKDRTAIWHIATARLARLLQAEGKIDEALFVLKNYNKNYQTMFEEIKGDLYFQKEDVNKAKESYLLAKKGLPKESQLPWLEMRLLHLGQMPEMKNNLLSEKK